MSGKHPLVSDRYKIVRELGQGAMGHVALAHDAHLDNKPVALKFIRSVGDQDAVARERFRREMLALKQLDRHPNLVQVTDFGQPEDGESFLVMNFIAGGTLQDRLGANNWPSFDQRDQLLVDLCAALDYMHGNGIIHRDLKPSNILIDAPSTSAWGTALVSDLGVSHLSDSALDAIGSGGTGTPGYKAPEQVRGATAITHRADIYALGVIAWQLFTRQMPPAPTTLASDALALPLRQVLLKALAAEPAERFDSANQLLEAVMAAPHPSNTSPFMGLAPFDLDDDGLFFGRSALVAVLAQRLQAHPFLAMVGASGSGKSSLVRAGLIPHLRELHDDALWPVVLMPGQQPLLALARALARGDEADALALRLAHDAEALAQYMLSRPFPGRQLLLVIDQFEELFTVCTDETQRQRFIDGLISAIELAGHRPQLVITLRADFFAQCLQYEQLRRHLEAHQKLMGRMSDADLRQAIEGPAALKPWQLRFESGLVDRLITDAGQEEGSLPLLSHALRETWQLRQGRRLTFDAYAATGGVQQAVANTANVVFYALSPSQQRVARNLFYRLTSPGEGTEDTRRQVSRQELITDPAEAQAIHDVLNRLVAKRLITITEDTVSLIHDAVIREWPLLQGWLDKDREWLVVHRRLTEAAAGWERGQEESSLLYRGIRLARVQEQLEDAVFEQQLNPLERRFLAASAADEQWRRCLARAAVATLALLFVVAVAAAVIAFRQQQLAVAANQDLAAEVVVRTTAEADAIAQENLATTREADAVIAQETAVAAERVASDNEIIAVTRAAESAEARQTAVYNEGLALTREVDVRLALAETERQRQTALIQSASASALAVYESDNDTELAILLALEAARTDRLYDRNLTWLTDRTLRSLIGETPYFNTTLRGHEDGVYAVTYSPDGNWLASGSDDGTIRLWPMPDAALGPTVLTGPRLSVTSLAFSPDGQMLAAGNGDGTVRLWEMDRLTATPLILQGHTDTVWSVAFSPDGAWLASGGFDQTVRLWDVANLAREPVVLSGMTDSVYAIAFDPDGRWIVGGGLDGTVHLWNLGRLAASPIVLRETGIIGYALAFSHDGPWLAGGGDDGLVYLWDKRDFSREPIVLTGPSSSFIYDLEFSPVDQQLAVATVGGDILIWNMGRLADAPASLPGHEEGINALAFSPDGSQLASSSLDKTIRLWELAFPQAAPVTLVGHTGELNAVLFAPQHNLLVSAAADDSIRLWNLADLSAAPTTLIQLSSDVFSLALSGEGRWLASGGEDGAVRIWDMNQPQASPVILYGHTNYVSAVAFSPDDSILASGSWDGTIRLWRVGNLEATPIVIDETGYGGKEITSLAFSPDGVFLASGNWDDTVKLWHLGDSFAPAHVLQGHQDGVYAVAFSPDGRWLASGSEDFTVRLWDMTELSAAPMVLTGHENRIRAVAFSLDGRWLTSGSADGTIRMWTMNPQLSGEPVVLTEPTSAVKTIAFSPDGRWLANGNSNNVIRLLHMPDELLDIGCQLVKRNLNREEWNRFLPGEAYRQTCPDYSS